MTTMPIIARPLALVAVLLFAAAAHAQDPRLEGAKKEGKVV
jgi:hypothetical protein